MATATEVTSIAEGHDSQRQTELGTPSVTELAMDQAGGPFGNMFSGGLGGPPANRAARVLTDTSLTQTANAPLRGIAFKRAQQTLGNHFVQRAIVQRKPSSTTIQRQCQCGGSCSTCQSSLSESASQTVAPNSQLNYPIQLKVSSDSNGRHLATPRPTAPSGPGERIAEASRTFMESRFGRDFSDVRIHTDQGATESADALNANAFTTGRDIYFAKGKYAPESVQGQRLLAHELVHVTQQESAPSISHNSASTGNPIVDPDAAQEHAADRLADQIVSPEKAASKSTRAAHNETGRNQVAPRSVTLRFGQAPIQRETATAVAEPQFPSVRRETVPSPSEGAANSAAVPEQMPALGVLQPIPGATGEDPFNPGSIVNDLRRAIDQSEVEIAGYEAVDPNVPYAAKMKFHRKVNFDAVYKALDNKSATEIKVVRDLYAVKEGKRSLDHDLFETGESGYPSNLTFIQRSRLQVLLRGTKADVLPPEIPEYLKRLKPEIAARLQRVLTESKLPAVRLNQLERTSLEIAQILSEDLDADGRERLMALHRRPGMEISVIDAFYESHTGVNLPSELSGKLHGLQLSRMYQLRVGNIPLADSFAIEDKRRAIAELDLAREANPIAGLALNIAVPGMESKLDKQRQKLVDQIDEIVAQNRQEAMEAAAEAGTTTTAAQAVAERLKTVLGQGRDAEGRNVGDLLKVTLGEKKAAELTAMTSGSLIEAHARRLAESEARNATKPEHILTIIRELRAEASHDVVARAADPWLPLEEKQKLLAGVEEAIQGQASAYVAQFKSAYESVRGEGRPWTEIVESFKDVDEDEVKRMTWGAGTMSDEEELDLAIRRDKPDLAIAILKRQRTQEDIQFLQMKYFSITGKWLETSLYGYRLGQAATAEEAEFLSGGPLGPVGGIVSGRQASLVAEQFAKPSSKDRGGFVEMQWVADSAEREFEVTWANRGVTGRLREIGDDPETETIMRESINEVRKLRLKWLTTYDNLEQRRILAEMKRWRATLTGDAAAYEEDNKKMLDKIRSVVSIAVQLALAIALPGAGATFMGFVRATAMQIAASVASNVVIYGEDYSLDQLRTDIVGGVLGAAGGKLGEEFVGAALAAKEARAAAGEITEAIVKPVADATARGAAKVGIGTTIAKEAASQIGSTAGQTLATGENQFTFENFFEGAWMSGVGVVGKKVLGLDGPKPVAEPKKPAGEGPTAVARPTEPETPTARPVEEPAPATEGRERQAPKAEVAQEPPTTKPPTSSAQLEASVERSSHMDTITDQQAANEVAYVDKHPELRLEGTPPDQYVKLGDHEIAAASGGGCRRRSDPMDIVCPVRFSPKARRAREQVHEHLKNMLENDIDPQSKLAYNAKEWDQFRRDYESDPERALADIEKRLSSHEVRTEKTGTEVDINEVSGPSRPQVSVSGGTSQARATEAGIPSELLGDATVMTRSDFPEVVPDTPPPPGRPAPEQLPPIRQINPASGFPIEGRPVSRSDIQNLDVLHDYDLLIRAGVNPDTIRINQRQVVGGTTAGTNRPDLSAVMPNGQRIHIEYDRAPGTRALDHAQRILTNDPDAIVILKIVDFD